MSKNNLIEGLSPAQIKDLKKGCTVWGLGDAKAIREFQQKHPDLIDIIDNIDELEKITGEVYDGAKRMPYFGAIFTGAGKVWIKEAQAKGGGHDHEQ